MGWSVPVGGSSPGRGWTPLIERLTRNMTIDQFQIQSIHLSALAYRPILHASIG